MRSKVTPKANLKFKWHKQAMHLAYQGVELNVAHEHIRALMDEDIKGSDSKKRLLGYLNTMWLAPKGETLDLRNKGLELYEEYRSDDELKSIGFFMLIACYPFIRDISEICGRLIRLQEEVKMEQIKRKASESYGDSEHIIRSTRYIVSILTDLGVLETGSKKGLYKAGKLTLPKSTPFTAFCLEAFMCSFDEKCSMRRDQIEGHLSLFSIDTNDLLNLAISDSRWRISRESINTEVITLV